MLFEKEFENIFDFEKKENKLVYAVCKLKKDDQVCGLKIKANSTGKIKKFNLWRHVKRQHINDFECIQESQSEAKHSVTEETLCKKPKLLQNNVENVDQTAKITISMDAKTFRDGLVEMICLSSAPIAMFNEEGFKKINGNIAHHLGVSLEQDSIRDLIIKIVQAARNELKVALKSNLLFLKIDAATIGGWNFVAVNAQFYCRKKKQMLNKLLDIIKTENQHSSEFIKNQIKIILQNYQIKESQILSICVDNADEILPANEEINNILYKNMPAQWASQPELILPDNLIQMPVQLMRCGIKALQLAVREGVSTELESIRQAFTKLSAPPFPQLLVERDGLKQSMESITRCKSTFLMLDHLLKFHDSCEEAATNGTTVLDFQGKDWQNIKAIRNVLEKPYLTILRLQSANLTPGIFFKEWYDLKKLLLEQEEEIAAEISNAMLKQENTILCNTHFLAGVYCDPSTRDFLTAEQKHEAKEGLLDINLRLRRDLNNEERLQPVKSISLSTDEVFKAEFFKSIEVIEKSDETFPQYPENLLLSCQIASSMSISHVRVEMLSAAVNELRHSLKDQLLSAILFYRFNCNEKLA